MKIKSLQENLKEKLTDPLFYFGLILLAFWILDSYLKLFVRHTPDQMLWWSSAGLGLSVIALFSRNSFLICSAFCALFFHEMLWNISYFSVLLFKTDLTYYASYMFDPNYPLIDSLRGLFHLLLLPFLILGIFYTKRIHRQAWIGAGFFALLVLGSSYLISNPTTNLNCIRLESTLKSCTFYMGYFQHLYKLNQINHITVLFTMVAIYAFFLFLPLNLILIAIGKKIGWKIDRLNFKKHE